MIYQRPIIIKDAAKPDHISVQAEPAGPFYQLRLVQPGRSNPTYPGVLTVDVFRTWLDLNGARQLRDGLTAYIEYEEQQEVVQQALV